MHIETKSKIQFMAEANKWFDKVNGNTYHSVRITRCSDGAVIKCQFQYGYGDQYRYTALEAMKQAGWIKTDNIHRFERENDYPIHWCCFDTTKRECVANGK